MRIDEMKGKRVYLWGVGVEGKSVQAWWERTFPGCGLPLIEDDIIPGDAEIIIKSPGVSHYLPQVLEAMARGVKFTNTVNIFLANKDGAVRTIAVTGTKGKSTTVSMLAYLLERLGLRTGLGGNIGVPPLEFLGKELDYAVLELSSFQITDVTCGVDYAVILNVSRAHTDWHLTYDNYVRDKLGILGCARRAVLNHKDGKLRGDGAIYYETEQGFHVRDGAVYNGSERIGLPPLQVMGEHNLSNLCACLAVLADMGLEWRSVLPSLADFKALPHRLQQVHDTGRLRFIDDSIATVPESTMAAVNAFSVPVAVIVGGYDNKPDYTALDRFLTEKDNVKLVLCLPDTGGLIRNSKAVQVADMEEAVGRAVMELKDGVVLLSPAAQSFNLYKNYVERGEHFSRLAKELS